MDSLKLLQMLASNENIAISVLSIMCILLIAGNIAQFIYGRKDRQQISSTHREDMKNAWLYVAKLSDTLKEAATNIEIIRVFAERKKD